MSQWKKILVAYDGSPHSKEALNQAIELSLLSKAQVSGVTVFDVSSIFPLVEAGVSTFMKEFEKKRQDDQKMIHDAIAIGKNKGVDITCEILYGNIADKILDYANKGKYDLIVAGTKWHGEIEGMLVGSVTRKLVSLARMPVMVVKD